MFVAAVEQLQRLVSRRGCSRVVLVGGLRVAECGHCGEGDDAARQRARVMWVADTRGIAHERRHPLQRREPRRGLRGRCGAVTPRRGALADAAHPRLLPRSPGCPAQEQEAPPTRPRRTPVRPSWARRSPTTGPSRRWPSAESTDREREPLRPIRPGPTRTGTCSGDRPRSGGRHGQRHPRDGGRGLEVYDGTRTRLAAVNAEAEGQAGALPQPHGARASCSCGCPRHARAAAARTPYGPLRGAAGRGRRSSPTTGTPTRPSSSRREMPGPSRGSSARPATRTGSASCSTPPSTEEPPGRRPDAGGAPAAAAPPDAAAPVAAPPPAPAEPPRGAGLPHPAAAARGRSGRGGRRGGGAGAAAGCAAHRAVRRAGRAARGAVLSEAEATALHARGATEGSPSRSATSACGRRTGSSTWW